MTTRQLTDEAKRRNGFTYSPSTGKLVTSGFAVSTRKDLEETAEPVDLAVAIEWYQVEHADELKRPGACMGAWYNSDEDQWYLDVVTVVPDREIAVRLATFSRQLAIYDLTNGHEIRI